ncbi:MAG: class I SAM-dependent methyltransferase [Thiohalocapsa sp.]
MNPKVGHPGIIPDGYGLSEAAYAWGYALRVRYSSFFRATLNWLVHHSEELIAADNPRLLSLGCGNGAFDIEFMDWLSARNKRFQFLGVDFNASELEQFRTALSSRDASFRARTSLCYMKYHASTRFEGRFHVIYMLHFLHSFAEVMPAIRNALGHLAQGGKLVIVQQKSGGVYDLKQEFKGMLRNPRLYSAEEIEELLRTEQVAFSSYTIDSYFDISIMRQMSLDALLLMSFCFADDLALLDTKQQEEIRAAFLACARPGADGVPVIYEPMEAIVCEAS